MGKLKRAIMPLPTKKEGESQKDYLTRCIPVEIEAGKSQSQATAICISEYKRQLRNNKIK